MMCTTCLRPASGEETVGKRVTTAINALEIVRIALRHASSLNTEEEWHEGEWIFATKRRKVTNFFSEFTLVITAPTSHDAALLRQVLGYPGAVGDELVLKLRDIRETT
jgi:hypothetical protein